MMVCETSQWYNTAAMDLNVKGKHPLDNIE